MTDIELQIGNIALKTFVGHATISLAFSQQASLVLDSRCMTTIKDAGRDAEKGDDQPSGGYHDICVC